MVLVVSENLNGYIIFDPVAKRDCNDSSCEKHEEDREWKIYYLKSFPVSLLGNFLGPEREIAPCVLFN
jgi:hypothetical protein